MKESIIQRKSFEFAIAVTACSRQLMERKEYVLSKQLLRSGTSIGANVREAKYAGSRLDFLYKLSISLRECSETMFWLELLEASNLLPQKEFTVLHESATELCKILSSITKTTRESLRQQKNPPASK